MWLKKVSYGSRVRIVLLITINNKTTELQLLSSIIATTIILESSTITSLISYVSVTWRASIRKVASVTFIHLYTL